MRAILDNPHLLREKFGRDILRVCMERVKGSEWENLIAEETQSPREEEEFKKVLKTWDKLWDENLKDKYGDGE